MRTVGKSLRVLVGLVVLSQSLSALGNSLSSAVSVMGEKPDCHGTFVHSGTQHDLMVLPATCLLNVDGGGLKVTGANGTTTRSVKAVIHPYLLKKKIYDLTKVPQSFDFAVALFPKGTASAVTPITRDFANSLSGFFTESQGKPEFFPEFQKATDESVTDLEPDQSVTPGVPIFDGASRGLVAVGLGCAKDAKGNESCTAVSLHDALSRDVLSEAKRQFPDSLAGLELPSKVHHLGHLGLFRRRQCNQPCYRPAPVYCAPVCQPPVVYHQQAPAPAPQVVNNYTNSFNRTYVHSPQASHSQQTQAYARGYADARANNTNTNTNTVSPVLTNTNVFKPSITVSPTISPNIVSSSPGAATGNSASPYRAVSYTSTESSDREVETRLAYESAATVRRAADAEAERTRAQANQEAQAAREAAAARSREQDAREVRFAEQSAQAAQEIKLAREEIQRGREEIAQLKATLIAEIAALAKERKEMEIERRRDRAKELKQNLDPKELEGVTGEEAGPKREEKASDDYTNIYRRPALLDAPIKRNYGVENIAARDSGSLRVEGAVSGTLPEPSLLASRTPFRPSSDLNQRSGVTELALRDMQNGKATSVRNTQLVVRSASPFLGEPTQGLAGNPTLDVYGQPTLAMYAAR